MTVQREVRLLDDNDLILSILAPDPRWTAYALCDLDPPYRQKSRFVGSLVDGRPDALVLLYSLGDIHALQAFGSDDGVLTVLKGYPDFPDRAFIILLPRYLPALQERYQLEDSWTVLRMVLEPDGFRPGLNEITTSRLSSQDILAVQSLYHHWGYTFFNRLMLENGVYHGVWQGSELLSVAGTHVVSTKRGIAAIGGVFTHPEHRGRGLASAATSAVTSTLLAMGINLVVLNVVSDNAPAIAVYRRLGFEPYQTYVEGEAVREL